ncbi:MAG TPA: glutathione S-transferase [Ferrovibrio sp.]|uniref:glutathione S-transferase n=1 Tax=Ferrovibrio sp. TaxID=1917215 RepID=UPI002B4B4EB2|nr:glutathione S-transferase [Ferrovibrio sp.]HLT75998.1 glutathione S-transferase [Ferrovibrio sp.]
MIQVHHLNNSRSQRVLWLLEELGLDYEVIRYERDRATMRAPAALQKIHPLGKSPVITDTNLQGGSRVIAESGAIIEYLVETYGQGRLVPPPGSEERLRYTYWLHYAEGSAMPLLLLKLIFSRMPKGAPALVRPIVRGIAAKAQAMLVDPQLDTHMTFWADTLRAQGGWFAGADFTAADIQMSFPLEAAAARIELKPQHQPIRNFLELIHARPAYRRALEKGGPYELLR